MQRTYFKESTDVALADRRLNAVSFINEVAAACNEDNKEEERNKNSKDASGGTRGSDLAWTDRQYFLASFYSFFT